MAVPASEPRAARAAAAAIVRILRDRGHLAYFAGGCVRDELLGQRPSDYDVATDAIPDLIAAVFRNTNRVGAAFGVMLVKHMDVVVEVATFRSDGEYTDKRRPDSVRFSQAHEDAARRDFTINALFLDPLEHATGGQTGSPLGGRVIDFVGGLADLRARVLRAVGDPSRRLAEDHLRALRAVRFAARLAFEIEHATAKAVRATAAELVGISRERIGDELRRMLRHPTRVRAVEWLAELNLDGHVLMEPGNATPQRSPRSMRTLPADAGFEAALAAWALDRGFQPLADGSEPLVDRWRRALCLSNDERKLFQEILDSVGFLRSAWARAGVAAQKRATHSPGFEPAAGLIAGEDPELAASIRARIAELTASRSGLRPVPLIGGDDLVRGGQRPGQRFKFILEQVYNAQLEDRVENHDQAMRLARDLARAKPDE